ncbi:replication endonuclease [Acetobacter cerevisiae]|uniref:replication endonuclease n=1 Tax=Acetobacter cerevisiae TaxID=178900 RepID=UPI000A51C0C0|nr:replication endonuclease [Acetobacter cerevisiae]
MQYEQIEIYLRNYHPKIWKNLLSLHHTYKNRITAKTAEICASDDAYEVAEHVVDWFNSCPTDIKNNLYLMSLSYDEIREKQRITKQRLTQKSNLLRRNFRRYINIRPEDDLFQQQFDKDKLDSEKSYIIVPDSDDSENGLSAHDVKIFNQRKKYSINRSISEHIDDFAINFLQYVGLFLSLTLESEFHNCDYKTAKNEINRRLKKIKRILKNKGILLLGMSVLELQKDETPHYHIQLYVAPEHREYVESVILNEFSSEYDRKENAIKDIWEALGLISYCLKDSGKSDTYISFIGLQRDIKSRYNAVFNDRKYKDLSDRRISLSHKRIRENQPNGMILLLLRGFQDERLNLLSSRHPDFHYLKTDIQKLQVMYLHCIHFREFKNLIDNKKNTYTSMRTYKIINKNNDIYNYVTTYVYVYQECSDMIFYSWECVKSRGQPPPERREKSLFSFCRNIISGLSADWHKNHTSTETGAESQENHMIFRSYKIIVNQKIGRPARHNNLARKLKARILTT